MKKILLSCFLLFAFFFSNAQLQTKLNPKLCGTVLKTSTGEIDAGAVTPAATAYRFVITHSGIIDTLESPTAFAQLGNLPNYTYNTTYSVGVVIKVNGVWGNLSRTSCVVTSSAPFTQLALNVCGTTLDLAGDIHADGAPLTTAYRFRVKHGSTVEYLDSPTREAKLSDLPDYLYNTTYTIDVAILVNGTWSNYGVACNVTTPVFATHLEARFCGTVLTTNDGQIYADGIPGATAYRFRATNGSHIDSVDSQISFARLGGMLFYDFNTTYSVQVTAKVNDVWLPYGPACTVTSPVLVPQISSVQCGTVLTTANGEIHVDLIPSTLYRFKVTQGAHVDSLQSTNGSVLLSALSFYAYNTTYSVQVTLERGGVLLPYGPACNVTTIAPSTNANLSALTLSTGALSPAFGPATLTYSATVSNITNSITVTPASTTATIQAQVNSGGYITVTNATASQALALNVGNNTINVKVTAQDGTTTQTYNINVTRAAGAPTVTTTAPATNITATTAALAGNVAADGGASVTDNGIVYSTSANPTTANTKIVNGTGTGAISVNVTGLIINTTYHYRAYATNSIGTTYGGDQTFTTVSNPIIATTGTLSALSTTYGTASATGTFSVSATNATAGILVTTPTGFEVSDNTTTGFGATVTIGSAGAIASTPVYIRLKATIAAGNYSGNVVLSSAGATDVNVATVSSTVSAAAITIAATGPSKTYGTVLSAGISTSSFSMTAGTLASGQAVTAVTLTPDAAGTTATTAANASYVVTPSVATGTGGFVASNYNITYTAFTGTVGKAALSITASTATKTYGQTLATASTSTAFSSSGLQNSETIGSVTLTYGTGAAATADVNTYTASVTPSAATDGSFNANNYSITYNTGNIVVGKATLTITANDVNKIPGNTLVNYSGSAAYTTTGLQNGQSAGTVSIAYGNGSSAGDAPGTYPNQVVPSNRAGGNINTSNYTIGYASGAIVIGTSTITTFGSLSALSTTYGSASGTSTFTVSGSNLSNNIVVTPPTGFEVASSSGGPYASTTTLTQSGGGVGTTNIYVRLAATTQVGNSYNGNVVVSSTGAASKNMATVTSTVNAAALTITASNVSKTYGDALTTVTASTDYTITSGTLKNGNAISSVTIDYSTGAAASDAVNTYTDKVNPSAAVGTNGFLASNYNITYVGGNITVNQKALTVTAVASNKTYDKTTLSSATPTYSGLISGDVVTAGPFEAYDSRNASTTGTLTPFGIEINGSTTISNYAVSYVAISTGVITKATATVTAQTDTKTYDRTTASSVAPVVTGLISGDVVGTAPIQTFDTFNVGTGKTLTAAGLVITDGNSGGNYTVSYVANATGKITAATATVTAQTDTKTYDRSTASSVAPVVTGLISGDVVGTAPTQTYDTFNVGTGKTLTASGLVITDGNSGGNYSISYVPNATGKITVATATVTAQTDTKTYNRSTASSIAPIVTGLISGDVVGTAPTQTFDTFNVGTGKTLTALGLVITDDNSGGNYTVNYVANATGVITKATATVTAQTDSKTYNRSAASSVAPVITGLAGGDIIGTAPTQTYDNFNVGTDKTLTASGLVINDGNSGANYSISYVPNITGIITTATATVTAQTDTKTYNRSTASSATPVVTGLASGDVVGTAPTQTFDNFNVGTGKTLTASGLVINDANRGANYSINYVAKATGVITTATATVTAQTDSKTYNRSTASSVAPVVTGLASGDVAGTALSQAFDTFNVGIGKTLTASGLVINDGNSGANYTINYVANTTGAITKATATVTAKTDNKTYNRSIASSIAPVVTGLASGDLVGTAPTQTFDTFNVGTGKTLTPSGLVINDSNSGNNYTINYVNNTTGVITVATATLTAQTDSKTYNKTTASAAVPVVTGLISPDAIGTTATQTFNNSDVGTDKTLTPTGLLISDGNNGNNYTINYINNTTGAITTATATVTAQTDSKVYDKTTASAAVPVVTGLISGDVIATAPTQTYNNANTGTGKTLTPSGLVITDGNSGGNYSISYVNNTTGTITTRALNVTAQGDSKVYDAGTSSSISPAIGTLINGDAVLTAPIQTFDTKAVGTGKTLTPSGLVINDGNSGNNYAVSYVNNISGVITPATLTYTANAVSRAYGAANPAFTGTVTGFAGSDTQLSATTGTASFTTTATTARGVGSYDITGADLTAANYNMVQAAANSTALTITPATLTITANDVNKVPGNTLTGASGSTAFTQTGLVGSDAVNTVTIGYGLGSAAGDAPGTYANSVTPSAATGTFIPANYNINYVKGSIIIGTSAIVVTGTLSPVNTIYGTASANTNFSVSGSNLSNNVTVTAPTGFEVSATAGSGFANSITLTQSGGTLAATTVFVRLSAVTRAGTYTGNVVLSSTGAVNVNVAAAPSKVLQRVLIVSATGTNKTYDGTATTTVTLSDNRLSGDVLTTAYTTAAFSDKNVGAGKTVNVSGINISGGISANYTVNSTTSTTANITIATATVAAQADTKVYNKTTASAVIPLVTGLLGTDAVGTTPTQTYNNVHVGTSKTLTASGLVINDGNGGNNYTINYIANATGAITVATVTVTAQADTKVYNKTTISGVLPLVTGLVSGDIASSNPSQTYNNANVGTSKTLTASGLVINDGNSGNNYTINYVSNIGAITLATATVTAQADTKVYNKTTTSGVVPVVTGLLSGDIASTIPTQTFNNANVGTAKTLTASGLVINDGNGGNNYAINYVTNNTGAITVATATVIAQADTKVYNKTTTSAIVPVVTGLINGDVASTNPTQTFNNANAGTGKTLTALGLVINDGNGGNNYSINFVNNTAGIITAKGLTVTAQTDSRVYNATTGSSAVPVTGALVSGDVIATTPTQSFDTKNAGTGKTLTASGLVINDGNGGNNYTIIYVANTTGVITTSVLTYTATPISKVYGAAVPALTGTVSGLVGTDNLASATIGSASFATIATATSSAGSYAITGSGLFATNGNYTFTQAAVNSTALTVTQAALTITATNTVKTYLQANPVLIVSYNGFAGTDNAASLTTQPTVSTTATLSSVPGTYSITATGAASPNYTFSYVAGTLTVLPISNANLSNLSISTGTLSPSFATGTAAYTTSVANAVTSVTITPSVADATATVKVNGTTVNSGSASTNIPLIVGTNTITTVATAQDGITKLTYTITVTRAPSSNASMSFITLSDGSLSPAFATGTTAYTASVGFTVNSITLTPTPADGTATITVNGTAASNGSASSSINLNVGDNTITTVVTAQDGTTKITYIVIIHRGAAPEAITATNIMSPNGDGVNDNWVIKDIQLYPNNTVTVYDRGGRVVFTKHGYTNDWTATINGSPLAEDTYYYTVDLGVSGAKVLTGFITVVRPRK